MDKPVQIDASGNTKGIFCQPVQDSIIGIQKNVTKILGFIVVG